MRKALGPTAGVLVVVALVAATAIDSVDNFLSDTDDAQKALWEALKTGLLVVAAVYAWYEFVYKQFDQSDERIDLELCIREGTSSAPRSLLIDAEIRNLGRTAVPFSPERRQGPEILIHFYDDSALRAIGKVPTFNELLPLLGYTSRAYPFLNSDGGLAHSDIEPGVPIRSTVSIVIPPDREPVEVVAASLRFESNKSSWTTDTATGIGIRGAIEIGSKDDAGGPEEQAQDE